MDLIHYSDVQTLFHLTEVENNNFLYAFVLHSHDDVININIY